MKLVIIGGHLAPALAVIDYLPKTAQVLFIGRKHAFEGDNATSLEYTIVKSLKIPFVSISTGRLQRRFTRYTIPSLVKIPYGLVQSFFILLTFKPDMVLGFGGYLSLPVILCAYLMRIPAVIHEQTQGAGLANRIASFFAKKICISWESSRKFFPKNKTVFTGNPIRQLKAQSSKLKAYGVGQKRPIIYITGGSSGSHFINSLVEGCIKELLGQFVVIHQTGDSREYQDFDRLKNLRESLSNRLKSRYILQKFISPYDISLVLQKADLVIARSGINTVTELIYFKKTALLIPLPYSQNKEQMKNAMLFRSLGLGEILGQGPLSPQKFLQRVKDHFGPLAKRHSGPRTYNLLTSQARMPDFENAGKQIIEVIEYVKKKKTD